MMALSQRVRRGLYCLYCYAPLPDEAGRSFTCVGCGAVNLKSDRQRYWTRARMPRVIEGVGMAFALAATVLLQIEALTHTGVGMGQGFVLALPLVVGGIFWQTARSVTCRLQYMDPGFFWYGAALCLGGAGLVDAGFVVFGEDPFFFELTNLLVLLLIGFGGVVLSLLLCSLRFFRRRWIGDLIRKRALELSAAESGSASTSP